MSSDSWCQEEKLPRKGLTASVAETQTPQRRWEETCGVLKARARVRRLLLEGQTGGTTEGPEAGKTVWPQDTGHHVQRRQCGRCPGGDTAWGRDTAPAPVSEGQCDRSLGLERTFLLLCGRWVRGCSAGFEIKGLIFLSSLPFLFLLSPLPPFFSRSFFQKQPSGNGQA